MRQNINIRGAKPEYRSGLTWVQNVTDLYDRGEDVQRKRTDPVSNLITGNHQHGGTIRRDRLFVFGDAKQRPDHAGGRYGIGRDDYLPVRSPEAANLSQFHAKYGNGAAISSSNGCVNWWPEICPASSQVLPSQSKHPKSPHHWPFRAAP